MRWINPKILLDGDEIRLDSPLGLYFIGTTAALLAGTLAGIGGGVASGALGSSAAKSAAKTQSDSTRYAADLQYKGLTDSNALQKSMFDTNQENIAPWLAAGRQGLSQMSDFLAPGGPGLEGYGAPPPTPGMFADSPEAKAAGYHGPVTDADVKAQFDPGFNYRMDLSNKSLNAWAASKGMLNSGGTGMKLIRNAQDMGSQEYQNAFGRAEGLNQQAFGQGQQMYGQDFANQMANYSAGRDTFYQNQGNTFSRLATLSGFGQSAAGQSGALGANYASAVGNNTMGAFTNIGNLGTAGAAATAAGDVGSANSWTSALSNFAKSLTSYGVNQSVFGNQSGKPSQPGSYYLPENNPYNPAYVPG